MPILKIPDKSNLRAVMTRAWELVNKGIEGGALEIIIQRVSKSREQEAKYHAMIGDIAKTVDFGGRKYDLETWKAKLVEQFAEEMKQQGTPLTHPGKMTESLDGLRIITIRPSTKKFRKYEANAFIEYLYATGIEYGARFTEPSLKHYEDIAA